MPFDPSNPWSYDAFGPAGTPRQPLAPSPASTAPGSRRKSPLPDQDEVFSIQKDLVKALSALTELENDNPKLDTKRVRRQIQNTYRLVNRYLRTHAR